MPTVVDVPDLGTVEFPDDMSEDQINQAIRKHLGVKQSPVPASLDTPQFQSPTGFTTSGQPIYPPSPEPTEEPLGKPFIPDIGPAPGRTESLLGISPEKIPSGAGTSVPGLTIPLSAAAKTAAGVAGYLTSPQGLLEVGASLTPAAPAVYAKWAYDMIKGGIHSAKDAKDELSNLIADHLNRRMASSVGAPAVPEDTSQEHIQKLTEDAFNTALSFAGVAGIGKAGVKKTQEILSPKPETPIEKGPEDATQERPLQESDQPEHPGTDAQRPQAEPSSSDSPERIPPTQGQEVRPLPLEVPPEPQFLGKSISEWTPKSVENLSPEAKRAVVSQTIGALKSVQSDIRVSENSSPEQISKAINEIASRRQAEKEATVHFQAPEAAQESRPLGIVAPGMEANLSALDTFTTPIKSLPERARIFWREFAQQSLAKFTAANREVGEAGVRYGAAAPVAREKGEYFAGRVMEGLQVAGMDRKLGVALTEDNLRGIKDAFQKAGNQKSADAVTSLIGKANSPFKTEQQYQDFLNSAEAQEAIARHKQLWEEEKDPIFRKANDLDPDAPLESRGLQTGARINLKNVMEGEGTKTTVGPAGRSSLIRQTATLLRKDPFARQAKGTGKSYEGSYKEIMGSAYEREYPVGAQHEFINSILDSGLGRITEREFPAENTIGGEPAKGYLMRLRPWAGKFLQIPKSLAKEYEVVSGLAPASEIHPYYTKAAEFLTKQAVRGIAEGGVHISNMSKDVFLGLGPTSNPLLNALLKVAGRSDLVATLPRVLIKAFSDQRGEMLKLAEINAAQLRTFGGVMGWLIKRIDQGVRLNSAKVYDGLADAGWVPDTETGLREYVNGIGNYNKKLQSSFVRWLRDTRVNPFATAGRTFLASGLREMTLSPNVKATTLPGALAFRVEKAAGIIGFGVLVGTLNYLLSGNALGPKGTRLGSVGWIGDDKKLHQFNAAKMVGLDRGPTQLGILPALEAKRAGLPLNSQLKAAAEAIGQTGVSTVAGPLNQFAIKAITGYRPGIPPVRESKPIAPQKEDNLNPLKTQIAENIKTAVQQANPAIDALVSRLQGKSLDEIMRRQLSRYYPTTAQSTKTIEALPKIVHSKDIKDYAEGVAKEARRLPLNKRWKYMIKRLDDDGAQSKDRPQIIQEVERHGVFKYP